MLHLLAKIFFSSIQIKVIDVRLLWTFIMHFILRREWGRREVKEGNIYISLNTSMHVLVRIYMFMVCYILFIYFLFCKVLIELFLIFFKFNNIELPKYLLIYLQNDVVNVLVSLV